MSAPTPTSLYILTTSQTPLGVRYPHPRKPVLVIPPLVHRTLHGALDSQPPSLLINTTPTSGIGSTQSGKSTIVIPHPETLAKFDLPPQRTSPTSPSLSISDSGEKASSILSDYELTVKLHLVGEGPSSLRAQWIGEALKMLSEYKGFDEGSVDTLLLGFKGMDYRGEKTVASAFFGCGSEGLEAPNTESIPTQLEDDILDIWKKTSALGVLGEKTKLGTLYATLGLLKRLVDLPPQVEAEGESKGRKVHVNALDTPDCHHLPKEYTAYAKENDIQLWAGGGGEGSDPLPSAHLHNLFQEFIPKLQQVISEHNTASASAGVAETLDLEKLEQLVPLREDGLKFVEEAAVGVSVRWVLGYTLLSKTRNVVHDKGYLIAADLA